MEENIVQKKAALQQSRQRYSTPRPNYLLNQCPHGYKCPCTYNKYPFNDGDIVLTLGYKCTQLICQNGVILPKLFYGQETCGCCEYNGRIFEDGDMLPGACARMYCKCGKWVVTGHTHDCCNECHVFGDPHIKTFDTPHAYSFYQWHDPCNYTITQRLPYEPLYIDTYNPEYAVYAHFQTCNGGFACLGKLLFVDSYATSIDIDIQTISNPDTIWVNGDRFILNEKPQFVKSFGVEHPVLAWRHDSKCIRIMGSQKLLLQVCDLELRIWAHASMSGKLGGLCGKFNLYDQDDYTSREDTEYDLTYSPDPVDPYFPVSWRTMWYNSQNGCMTPTDYNNITVKCAETDMKKWNEKCSSRLSLVFYNGIYPSEEMLSAAIETCTLDLCKTLDLIQAHTWLELSANTLLSTLKISNMTVGDSVVVPIPSSPECGGTEEPGISWTTSDCELTITIGGSGSPTSGCLCTLEGSNILKQQTFDATTLTKIILINTKITWEATRGTKDLVIEYNDDCIANGCVHLYIPTDFIEDLCKDGTCYPTLCKLHIDSEYSSVPSYNTLLFVDEFCTIKKPDRWGEYINYYFGSNSNQNYYGDYDEDGLANVIEYYGLDAFVGVYTVISSRMASLHQRKRLQHHQGSIPRNNGGFKRMSPLRQGVVLIPIQDIGTNPLNPDTDGDLLTDGFEVYNYLDPRIIDLATDDYDGDGLNNLEEQIYQLNPNDPDTDGDGFDDGTEIAQLADPTNPVDNGTPPPGNCSVKIKLSVGDHSGSHSERYILHVGPISYQSIDYGIVSSSIEVFYPGVYVITLEHSGTILSTPDYDYYAQIIQSSGNALVTVADPEGILGYHSESSYFYALGKIATLTVDSISCPPDPNTANCSHATCGECRADLNCAWHIERKTCIPKHFTNWGIVTDCDDCPCDKCKAWHNTESQDLAWLHEVNQMIPCPCTVNFVTVQWNGSTVQPTNNLLVPADQPASEWRADHACTDNESPLCSLYQPGAFGCLRSVKTTPSGAGQHCCYDSIGSLIGPTHECIGTPDKASPEQSIWPHNTVDLVPYKWCCMYCEELDACKYYTLLGRQNGRHIALSLANT